MLTMLLSRYENFWESRPGHKRGTAMNKYSLRNLRDISLPEPPSLWPPAPGAFILILLLLLVLLYGGFIFYHRRKENSYRKAGLLLMRDAVSFHEISIILKRVALAGFAREQVASLYGEEWISFLNNSCPRCKFAADLPLDSGEKAEEKVRKQARQWIRHHITTGNAAAEAL